MKTTHILFIIFLFLGLETLAQGANCAGADPFCTDVGATFPASTSTTSEAGADYGCLSSQPNPAWYYMEIGTSGNIEIDLTNDTGSGSGVDIDFACWGPFNSATGNCLPTNPPVDCSFSGAATESVTINGAVAGDFYLLLVTNFSGSPTDITATANGSSTGATDCSILSPSCTMDGLTADFVSCNNTPFLVHEIGGTVTYTDPPINGQLIIQDCYGVQQVFNAPFGTSTNYTITDLPQDGGTCNITAYFTADPACTITTASAVSPTPITAFSLSQGICDPGTNTFTIDGDVTFSNPPAGGTLTIEVNNGTNTYTATVNAPFASPETWTIPGIPADGAGYTVSYYFSNYPMCGNSLTGTAPNGCQCTAEAGTFSGAITGDGTTDYILCFGDQIDISTNNDYTSPGDESPLTDGFGNPIIYDPGVAYLVYSCPPTVLAPNALWDAAGLPIDPCLIGVASFGDIFTDQNVLGGPSYAGPFTNNTIYYVPITTYSNSDGYYAISINGGDWCYDMGTPFAVQYLPEITTTEVTDCNAATATITINGGLPELDGSNFTVSNLLPATASFVNTTCANGGTITISGLQNGDMYSFDIIDDNGCPISFTSGPFVETPTADAGTDDTECSLTYTLAANPSFGTGAWTGTAGVAFTNAASATSSVTVPSAGSYTFTWTESTGAGCSSDDQVIVQFSDIQYTEIVNQSTCGNADGDITITGNSGIGPYIYSIDNGTTTQAAGAFPTLSSGNYNIIVEDAIGCQATGIINITDLGGPTIDAINGNDISCNAVCDGDIAINTTGGTQFSIDNGTSFQAANNFAGLCAGNYDIVVADALGCEVSGNITLTEPIELTHTTTKIDLTCANLCIGEIDITAVGGSTPYQYSIDNGATTSATGLFQNLCAGTYDILITDLNSCTSTSQVIITQPTPITVTIGINDASCFGVCDGYMNSIPAGGTAPYNYTWTPAAGGNVPLVTGLCAGSYDLEITDNNGCVLDTNGIVVEAPAAVTIDNVTVIDETCGGDGTGEITVTSTGGTSFSINGGTLQPSNVFSNLTAGNYTILAQNFAGCNATGTAVVTGPPPVTVTASGIATICNGQSTSLTAVAAGGIGPYTYLWDNGDITATTNVTPSAPGQNYCVTAFDAGQCPSAAPACINVVVSEPLNLIALSDQAICEGEFAQISALAGGGNGGPYTYTWDQGVGVGQNQSVSPTFQTIYTVTVTDNCTTIPATAQVTIDVNTIPNITFVADVTEGCAPVAVNFTASNVPVGSTYLWSFGDGGASQDGDFTSYSFENPGCWDISLDITTAEGCQSNTSIPGYICVFDYPNPEFTFAPQPTTILNPTVVFDNQTIGNNSYNWTFDTNGAAENSTSTDPSYTFAQPGIFEVCLDAVSINGCPGSICHDVEILEEFLVYVPNAFTPDGDELNNEFAPIISGITPDSYEFLVFNRWGQLIFQSQIPGKGWTGIFNGVMSQQDVYVWKLSVDDQLGKTHDYTGHVTLIK